MTTIIKNMPAILRSEQSNKKVLHQLTVSFSTLSINFEGPVIISDSTEKSLLIKYRMRPTGRPDLFISAMF